MRHTIDKSLPSSWCIELEDGTFFFDQKNLDGPSEWIIVRQHILDNKLTIKRLHLFSMANAIDDVRFNGALTPTFQDGYYLSNTILAQMQVGVLSEGYKFGWIKDNKLTKLSYSQNLVCEKREEEMLDSIDWNNKFFLKNHL